MSVISALTVPEIVTLYNLFATKQGSSTVKKFRDRRTGEQRLQDISRGLERKAVLAIFKKANIKKEVIDLLPTQPAAVVPERPEPASTTHTPPEALPTKNPALLKEEEKERQRWEKEQKKEEKTNRKERRSLPPQAAIVLECLKRLIKPEAKGDAAHVTSTDVAKSLSTSIATVCKAVEQLDRLGLVSFEDDSPDDNTKFYYITLTAGGRGLNTADVLSATAPSEPTTTAPSKPNSPRLPADAPGPRPKLAGQKIYKLVQENPRRVGTHGHKSFALIKDGMTYEAYKAAGGRNNDLSWDIDHGFVELR
jgi:DNA-binding MarR family transcriptional regulator